MNMKKGNKSPPALAVMTLQDTEGWGWGIS